MARVTGHRDTSIRHIPTSPEIQVVFVMRVQSQRYKNVDLKSPDLHFLVTVHNINLPHSLVNDRYPTRTYSIYRARIP
jgi:hypothetical protein